MSGLYPHVWFVRLVMGLSQFIFTFSLLGRLECRVLGDTLMVLIQP